MFHLPHLPQSLPHAWAHSLTRTVRALSPGAARAARTAANVPGAVVVPSRAPLVGRPHVLDGSTLLVRQTRVHLAGLAPQGGETRKSRHARQILRDLCANQRVQVEILERSPQGSATVIGRARLPDGRDLSAEMLARGAEPLPTEASAA
ncbi:hypothetical protein [Pseudoruegeria sp. SHC-113]|uniref:hypothetical protein n=1 Tax=Pseudoruegeria sp. SHC-113 TaxID=2855439 RepID=UPI0021BB6642|nr:hypothetical protein [Pseudoruegeria sp. SHC-113]MCT8162053.1 hypothetical protein [Pseudoruegeria sp. SHC-113]